jgi:MYXO-CTERM domain-containing protein
MQANYGRRYPWDAFGYHIYVDQGGATTAQHLSQYLDAVATLKTQYADATPIWITEFGWQAPSVVSEAQQAANIDLALTTFEARSDVERAFVFKVDDYDDWGIFRGDFSKKPAAQTMIAHDTGCTHLPKVIVDAGADASADAGANAGAGANAKADADANGDADANADADTNAGAHADGGACSVGSGAGSSSLLASLAMLLFAARRRRR